MKDEIKEILDFKEDADYKKLSVGEIVILENYITNLQQRNIELMVERDRLKELCNAYEEEHSTTFEEWKQLVKEDYKSRNEKAIEYIWSTKYEWGDLEEDNEDFDVDIYKLLNILQGEDKDVKD